MGYLGEETKERIVRFVDSYYADNGYTPTIAKLAAELLNRRLADESISCRGAR